MKVSASGQSIREVLLSIKAQGDPGNAQRVKQEAQRIKKAEDDLNRERTGRKSESLKYLTAEEEASAKYHLARMRREKEYHNERKRIAREQEMQQARLHAAERRQQVEVERFESRRRREFAAAASLRQGRSSRLGMSGIGQDTIGVLRGVGHIGISTGLFGDSTENILDALLAVEGGFNVARYGSPLLTNLARTRGFRRGMFGGARRLSGLLGMGVGIGGTAGGTALGGTIGLAGAAGGAAIGGGLGAFAAFDFARQAWNNGIGGGAAPGSYSDTVASAGVNALRGRPATRGFVRGALGVATFGVSEAIPSLRGYWGAAAELDRTDERLRRQQLGAEDIRRWAMADEARFATGMDAGMARTGSLLFGSGPMLERQLSQNRAQQSILGGSLSALAIPGDPQSGFMLQGEGRAQALQQLAAIKQQEVALQEQMHARDMAHWRAVAQNQDEVLQKRLQEKAIVEDQVRSRASSLAEMSPGQLQRLERAFQDATDGDGRLSNANRSLLNRNRGLIPGDLPELDRANLDRARRGAPGITSRLDQAVRDADARINEIQTAAEDFAEKMAAVQEKSAESLKRISDEAEKTFTKIIDQIEQAMLDKIDEMTATGDVKSGQGPRAPGSAI